MSLAALLTDPRSFFRERADDPSLLFPAVIVALLGVLTAATTIPSTRATMTAMPPEVQGFGTAALVIGAAVAFVIAFILWLIFAGIFHAISSVAFGGEGGFTDTLAVTGWGYVPRLLSAAVNFVAAYVVYSGVDFSSAQGDPQAISQTAQQLSNDPLLMTASIVTIAVTLWSGALWTFGLAEVRNIEVREAAISVAIVVLGSVGMSVWGLI